jgi:hypothetical protein
VPTSFLLFVLGLKTSVLPTSIWFVRFAYAVKIAEVVVVVIGMQKAERGSKATVWD